MGQTGQLIIFLAWWGVPALLIIYIYCKMEAGKRASIRERFASFRFLSTIGLLIAGVFCFHLGSLLSAEAFLWAGGICVALSAASSLYRSIIS
ncbi:hypothetical protein [Domibacillus indicus]|uniref:hypothetical protein n=1 Tax=Domibacillus indicus TaxID=1437523 RepID=UPI00061810BC|nr:hypothetical protein [Domibacillus indicus]